jgi:hypothetical protein
MDIIVTLPGGDPYTAPYTNILEIKGEENHLDDTVTFRASKLVVEDLVRRLKIAGAPVWIRKSPSVS